MPRHKHGQRTTPVLQVKQAQERSSLPKSGEVGSNDSSEVLRLDFLPDHAKAILAELKFTALDCANFDALELSGILAISESLAKAVQASLRVKAGKLLQQATETPSREIMQVIAPPLQSKRSWLTISLQARAGPVTLLSAKKAKLDPTQNRREKLLDTIFDVAVALGAASLRPSRALQEMRGSCSAEVRASFLAQFQSLDTETLAKRVGALKRWAAYAAAHLPVEVSVLQPSAEALIQFFGKVSRGGPKAAADVFKLLSWWKLSVGVPFPLDDPSVCAWAQPKPGQSVHQQIPLPLMVFCRLLQLASSAAGTIRKFTLWALLPLFACLRFKHLSMSINLRREGSFLRATCPQGKRRVQHTRPPFDWACPLGIHQDKPVLEELLLLNEEFKRELGKEPTFIIPDIVLDQHGKVTSTSKLLLKPMQLAKFVRILQSFCIACSLSEAEARQVTSYALRRFLPTVAGTLKIPESFADAIGDWQQSCTKGAPQSMATRYNDDRVLMAADTKARMLTAVGKRAKELRSCDLSWDHMRSAFTWNAICSWKLPTFSKTTGGAPCHSGEVLATSSHDVAGSGYSEAQKSSLPVSNESDSDASSSGGSTSDSESSLEQELIEWFQQTAGGRIHLTQAIRDSALVPWCRSTPFGTTHLERGNGIDKSHVWCDSCIKRCPPRLSRSLRQVTDA